MCQMLHVSPGSVHRVRVLRGHRKWNFPPWPTASSIKPHRVNSLSILQLQTGSDSQTPPYSTSGNHYAVKIVRKRGCGQKAFMSARLPRVCIAVFSQTFIVKSVNLSPCKTPLLRNQIERCRKSDTCVIWRDSWLPRSNVILASLLMSVPQIGTKYGISNPKCQYMQRLWQDIAALTTSAIQRSQRCCNLQLRQTNHPGKHEHDVSQKNRSTSEPASVNEIAHKNVVFLLGYCNHRHEEPHISRCAIRSPEFAHRC